MPTGITTVFEGMEMQELLERPAEPKRAEALREARSTLLAGVLAGEPLLEWLNKLTLALEQTLPGLMGSVLLLESDRLRLAAAPSLPESYNRLVDNHSFGEGMGSCGTAAFRAQMVVVCDIQSDPLWKNYREVARRFGLGACWSMPFFDRSKKVKGTVAVYSREPRRPLEEELAIIREFAMLAAVGCSHHRLEDRVRVAQAKFDELVDDVDVIVWRGGPEGRRPSQAGRTSPKRLVVRSQTGRKAIFGAGSSTPKIGSRSSDNMTRRFVRAPATKASTARSPPTEAPCGCATWFRPPAPPRGASGCTA